jgi:hypothetical protein
MDIGRAEGVGGPRRIEGTPRVSRTTPAAPPPGVSPADKVDLSPGAQLVSQALALPAVRLDRVDEVKRLLVSGRFETDVRLQGALDRFLAERLDP